MCTTLPWVKAMLKSAFLCYRILYEDQLLICQNIYEYKMPICLEQWSTHLAAIGYWRSHTVPIIRTLLYIFIHKRNLWQELSLYMATAWRVSCKLLPLFILISIRPNGALFVCLSKLNVQPNVNDIVAVQHQGINSKGIPVSSSAFELLADQSWKDLVKFSYPYRLLKGRSARYVIF
jgi:hypothetical protein